MNTEKLEGALRALCAKEKREIARLEAELQKARRDERPSCEWLVSGLVITIGIREKHVAEIEAIISGAGPATPDEKAAPAPGLDAKRRKERPRTAADWTQDPYVWRAYVRATRNKRHALFAFSEARLLELRGEFAAQSNVDDIRSNWGQAFAMFAVRRGT